MHVLVRQAAREVGVPQTDPEGVLVNDHVFKGYLRGALLPGGTAVETDAPCRPSIVGLRVHEDVGPDPPRPAAGGLPPAARVDVGDGVVAPVGHVPEDGDPVGLEEAVVGRSDLERTLAALQADAGLDREEDRPVVPVERPLGSKNVLPRVQEDVCRLALPDELLRESVRVEVGVPEDHGVRVGVRHASGVKIERAIVAGVEPRVCAIHEQLGPTQDEGPQVLVRGGRPAARGEAEVEVPVLIDVHA